MKPGESAGYFGYKSENAKGSANKDLKEFFHAYQNKTLPNITEKETRDFQEKLIKMVNARMSFPAGKGSGWVFAEP